MLDDVESLSVDLNRQHRSLVQQMLEIQKLELPLPKSFDWMGHLTYLSVEGLPSLTRHNWRSIVLREVEVNLFDVEDLDFITISYTWDPVQGEPHHKQGFKIQTLSGKYFRNRVRDIIIWRAIRYAQHHNLKGFWIDRQCLDQTDDKRHAIAMNSMDRLYAHSPRSLGMTTIMIDQQWKLDVLHCLLTSSLTRDSCTDAVNSPPVVPVIQRFWRMVKWLVRLLSDGWWQRAWIFQEEYCAAQNMHLLIPCTRGLSRREHLFGSMLDEVEISAVELRTQLTRFAIACQHDVRLDARRKHYIQKYILQRAERYRISYQYNAHRDHNLSSLTAADLQRRCIGRPEDYLAVLANCCGYARRIDHRLVKKRRDVSLALSMFVQALLNGEILRNSTHSQPALTPGFADFFRRHILVSVTPPADHDKLTFTKHCRFLNVKLCKEGIMTTGHLWHVTDAVPKFSSKEQYLLSSTNGLSTCLRGLAQALQGLQPGLACLIENFSTLLQQQISNSNRTLFMMAMAKEVAAAWTAGRALSIARLKEGDLGGAIFVHDGPEQWLFTSWYDASDEPHVNPEEPINKHVWLVLESNDLNVSRNLSMLRISKWVHGLCFFQGVAPEAVVFPWPGNNSESC